VLLGALIGALGAGIQWAFQDTAHIVRFLVAGVTILAAFSLLFNQRQLQTLDGFLKPLSRWTQPLIKRLLPAAGPLPAFLLGSVWALIPCGLVYSAAVLALAADTPLQGALVMLFFGFGTLPVTLTISTFARQLTELLKEKTMKTLLGSLLLLVGIWNGATPLLHDHNHQHAGHSNSQEMQHHHSQ